MDEPDLDVSANVAGPSDLEARSGTGLDAAEQAGAGEIREGGDAEMDDARSDGGAEEGGNDELQNEKGEDMEDFETLEEKGSGNRDGEVVNADSEALEAEPDYEEKEKDWDADIEDEDIGAYAENEEEGVERREAAGHVLDGVAEAHAEEQAGEEAGLEGEEGGNAAGTGEGHMEGAQKAEITLPLARVKVSIYNSYQRIYHAKDC